MVEGSRVLLWWGGGMSGDGGRCSDRWAVPQASKALLEQQDGRDHSVARHLRQSQEGADLGSILLAVMSKGSRDAKGEGAILPTVVAVTALMSLR